MNKIEIIKDSITISACYKKVEETDSWIAQCEAEELWGKVGSYEIKITDATVELENIRNEKELLSKNSFKNSFQNNSDIIFEYNPTNDKIAASLTETGILSGVYNLLTLDSKGRVVAANLTDTIIRFSAKTNSTIVNSSNTYTSINQLTISNLPSGLYKISFFGVMQSGSSTSGLGVRLFNPTAIVSFLHVKWFIAQGASSTSNNFQYEQLNNSTNITSASTAIANANYSIYGHGVVNITTSGSISIQTRPENNNTAASLLANSYLVLELL